MILIRGHENSAWHLFNKSYLIGKIGQITI